MGSSGGGEVGKTLIKGGVRIIEATRRPDGTLRKPIRVKDGYVPPDEVPIYKSKGALLKEKESIETVPPGYDPDADVVVAKVKSKAAKRNERKKEKRSQASSDKGKSENEDVDRASESVESIVSQINDITISGTPSVANPPLNSTECSATGDHVPDIDKRIRALKKKDLRYDNGISEYGGFLACNFIEIRLTEAQQQKAGTDLKPEQLDKVAKLDDWRQELKLLEDEKASLEAL